MKKFIFEDFEKKYEAGVTEFKKKPGAPPVMHFLDEEGDSKKQVTFQFDIHNASEHLLSISYLEQSCVIWAFSDGHL